MTKIEKLMPATLEDAQHEIKRLRQKEKKRRERVVLLLFAVILLAFCIGFAVGDQSGYHAALVDFNIIAGYVI